MRAHGVVCPAQYADVLLPRLLDQRPARGCSSRPTRTISFAAICVRAVTASASISGRTVSRQCKVRARRVRRVQRVRVPFAPQIWPAPEHVARWADCLPGSSFELDVIGPACRRNLSESDDAQRSRTCDCQGLDLGGIGLHSPTPGYNRSVTADKVCWTLDLRQRRS